MSDDDEKAKPKDRINWTSEEHEALMGEMIRRYGHGDWTVSVAVAARAAQDAVLPPERRRPKIQGAAAVAHLSGLLAKEKSKAARAARAAEAVPPVPHLAVVPQAPENTPEEESREPIEWIEETPDLSETLSSLLAGVLVGAVRKLLTSPELAQMLRNLQLGQMPVSIVQEDRPRHNPAPVPSAAAKERKLALLLCGFKPHQQPTFLQAFPDVHLKFWYAERPNQGLEVLKEKARTVDAVLFTMEATSHSAVATVQNLGKRIVRVTGGATAMQTAIENLRARVKHNVA